MKKESKLERKLSWSEKLIDKEISPLIEKSVKEKTKIILAKIPVWGCSAAEGYGILNSNSELFIEPQKNGQYALKIEVDWYGKFFIDVYIGDNIEELKNKAIFKIRYAKERLSKERRFK